MLTPWYCSREDVLAALASLNSKSTNQVDKAIAAATNSIEELTHRKFFPMQDTRYFDFPNDSDAIPGRLWLDDNDLLAVEELENAGTVILNYVLYPAYRPYDRLELNRAYSDSFTSGATYQNSIAITGTFGYTDDKSIAGELLSGVNASVTTIQISDPTNVGVGNMIEIGTERMIITAKNLVSSSQTIQANLTAKNNDASVAVTTGSYFNVGEKILVGSEKMLVLDIAGNTLIVDRAVDGSVLSAHTSGDTVYAYRTITVERGSVGSTAASHSSGDDIYKHIPPAMIVELCIGEAINNILQNQGGYSRSVGSDDNQRPAGGRSLTDLRNRVVRAYGRFRVGAV